jgi:hypothetical protein
LRVFFDFFDEPLQRSYSSFFPAAEQFRRRIGESAENYLSTMEHGKMEIGAEILLRIGREFAKRAGLTSGRP